MEGIRLDDLFDVGPEKTVFLCELIVIDLFQILKIVLYTLVVLGFLWLSTWSQPLYCRFSKVSQSKNRLIGYQSPVKPFAKRDYCKKWKLSDSGYCFQKVASKNIVLEK